MKTRREAWSEDCSALSSSRAAATSGRSCSAACRTFFKRDLVAVVKTPDRAHGDLELLLALEPVPDLFERQVGLFGNEIEQPLPVCLERRAAVSSAGLGLDAARSRPAVEPSHRRRSRDIEQARDLAPALPLRDHRYRALA